MDIVTQYPVARESDPITSWEAGENPSAKELARARVYAFLRDVGLPRTQHQVEAVLLSAHPEMTGSRIRSAFTELERQRMAERVDFDPTGSSTGGRAQTWKAVAA